MTPTAWFALSLVLTALVGFSTPGSVSGGTTATLLGLVLIGVGLALNIAGSSAFRAAGTPIAPSALPTRLVTTGVFSFSRNPMYLGMVLILVGLVLLLARPAAGLVPVLFGVLVTRTFIAPEEARLAQTFGPEWQEYRTHVRRWL